MTTPPITDPPASPTPITLALGSLHIHAFRGLQDVELKNPGRFNLLVGPNNSGKTSILEAISYFCRPADPVHWWHLGLGRAGSATIPSLMATMLACFPKSTDKHREVSVTATHARHKVNRATLTCTISNLLSQHHRLKHKSHFTWNAHKYDATTHVENLTIENDEEDVSTSAYQGPQMPIELIDTFVHRNNAAHARAWSALAGTDLQKEVLIAVQYLDSAIIDLQNIVHIEDGITELQAIHKTLGACSLSMFGDGFKRALAYALGLVHAKGGVLLIDEIEMAIHKSALERVYGWLRKMCEELNVQVFATTHSLEAVEAMLGDQPSEDTVCYQLGEGGKVARRWSGDLLWRIVKQRGLDVR